MNSSDVEDPELLILVSKKLFLTAIFAIHWLPKWLYLFDLSMEQFALSWKLLVPICENHSVRWISLLWISLSPNHKTPTNVLSTKYRKCLTENSYLYFDQAGTVYACIWWNKPPGIIQIYWINSQLKKVNMLQKFILRFSFKCNIHIT